MFPLFLRAQMQRNLFNTHETTDEVTTQANLSDEAKAYLQTINAEKEAELLFFHTVAVLHAPNYRDENAGALRQDWPRVPLPAVRDALEASAALGRCVAALLDTESPVSGVTSGSIRTELRAIANIRRADGPAPLDPQAGDLDLRAGWGHRGKGGVVMPGRGNPKLRPYTDAEYHALQEGATRFGLTPQDLLAALGAETYDVYLNGVAAWMNVPARVWDYTIGGYQVIKKWLSYREAEILGRGLTTEEAREVTQMARRIAAILLLERELDASYERVKARTYDWPAATADRQ
jgi:hypothetical protein